MKVKICGIKTVEAASHAVEYGADALGFVFAESKRQITVFQAKKIIDELPEHVWKVGVFVNEDALIVKEIARTAGLTHIQLHGDENPSEYETIGLPLIRSQSVRSQEDLMKVETIKADYILLDSPPGKYRGGNGSSFDWEQAKLFGHLKSNIILAGGLNPKNVRQAIAKVKPIMVDVSSGVESNGEKDLLKIKEFIYNAKKSGEEK
ncbi:phosphoribosylanthranilate isomerase [Mesobacillus boroniphilus]|uniref:N-(5'-phosphoribosyl)anthranilate isomerase n=1 Tax=Mesobacillus boroniphilus TaxID=308892 RepID=A0A944CKU6_9BACI|nr:phosphoribosylanthranilate isomerase [Mesobacillus boroniphilus]MBS8264492.1 phosphoribosylanthranilate isomerase [Mesobacillus boroniphilus]